MDDGAILDVDDWDNGQPHGSGVLATMEGDVYRGLYCHGEKHGPNAVYVHGDGRVYRGAYVHDKRHGQGVLTWPYGAWYEGAFAQGKRCGMGEYHYADGRVYKGQYQNDRSHGYGVLRAKDGTVIYDGQWELGEFLGSATSSSGNR